MKRRRDVDVALKGLTGRQTKGDRTARTGDRNVERRSKFRDKA